MVDRICRGCPTVIVPALGERRKREWCSGACRLRVWRRENPDAQAVISERTRLKVAAARATERGNCRWCGEPIPVGRSKTCGAPDCLRARNAARVREGYRADPELARSRVAFQRAQQTAEQRAASKETRQRWRRRVGYTQSMRDGQAKRRARKAAVLAESFDRNDVFDRDGWVCGICRTAINPDLRHPDPMSVSLDHIVPLALGGPHTRANTRPAHLICNIRRSTAKAEDLQLVLI